MQGRLQVLDRLQIHRPKCTIECSVVYLLSASAISQAFGHQFSSRKHWFEHKPVHVKRHQSPLLARNESGREISGNLAYNVRLPR
jgi:hypothetical protein